MPGPLTVQPAPGYVTPPHRRAPALCRAWPARPRPARAAGGGARGRAPRPPPRADRRGYARAVDVDRPESRSSRSNDGDDSGRSSGVQQAGGNGAAAASAGSNGNGAVGAPPAPPPPERAAPPRLQDGGQPLPSPPPPGGGAAAKGGFGITLRELQRLLSAAADSRRSALPPLPPALAPPAPAPGAPRDAAAAASAAADALAAALRSSPRRGLPDGDAADAAARAAAFGTNRLPDAATSSLWQLLAEAASDTTMLMLMGAGALSLALSAATKAEAADYIDGAAILASVVICVGFAAGTNYSKESKFRKLNAAKDDVPVRVIRGEHEVAVSIFDLLVGDVLVVEAGDILPADGLLLPGSGELKVDESQLTGESDDVLKDPVASPVCFSGSKVLEGFGRLLVLAVGPNSQQGLINAAVIAGKGGGAVAPSVPGTSPGTASGAAPGGADALRQQTALSAKLEGLAHTIGRLGMGAAAVTLLYNCAVQTADLAAAGRLAAPWALAPDDLQRYLDFVITSITLLVVAVPEGLPLAVTLALAFSVQRMLADNNLVRHLDACETMAGCTTICSDKTGTLTANDMRVTHLMVDRAMFRVRRSATAVAVAAAAATGGAAAAAAAAAAPARGGRGGEGAAAAAEAAAAAGGAAKASAPAAADVIDIAVEAAPGGASAAGAAGGAAAAAVAAPAPGDSADSLSWLVPEADMQPCSSIENIKSVERLDGSVERLDGGRAYARGGPRPGRAGGSRPGSAASSAGSTSSGSGDALSTLGMDQATYVSLSLDGCDEDLLKQLLAQKTAAATAASAAPAAPSPAGAGANGVGGAASFHGLSPHVRDLLVFNITLNSTASVRYDPETRTMDRSGNRTECALLEFAYRLQGRREALAAALASRPRIVQALPFTSARKLMAVVVADAPASPAPAPAGGGGGGGGRGATVFVKGAGEILLDRCSHRLAADGSEAPLSDEERAALRAQCGKGGLRVLALAHKRLELPPALAHAAAVAAAAAAAASHHHHAHGRGRGRGDAKDAAAAAAALRVAPPTVPTAMLNEAVVESGLVLTGLVGIEDPLRPEVPGAIRDCQRAGILVRMITGDNARTAAAIARACGVLPREWAEGAGGGGDAGDEGAAADAAAAAAAAAVAGDAAAERVAAAAVAAATLAPGTPGDADTELWACRGAGSLAAPGSPCAPGTLLAGPGSCGFDPRLAVLEGPVLRRLVLRPDGSTDLDAFAALWPHVRVLARCSPGDKHMLVEAVKALRAQGRLDEVVAMTGDGTNDAPALAAADVGFAMAAGTCIARDASDILLLDNNFRSIVSAVKWGRNVYASVTKFLQFQLTANVVAVTVAAGGAVLLRSSPLSAVQMLWVNLIMDSLASLALATESPTDELLDEPPHRLEEPLVPPTVVKHILGQAALQLALLAAVLGPLGDQLAGGDGEVQRTLLFNTFVWLQLFNQINCRRVRDSQANVLEGVLAQPQFGVILAAEAALQVAIVEFGGRAFSTVPLSGTQWAACIAMGATSLLVRAGLRLVPVSSSWGLGFGGKAGSAGKPPPARA